MRLWRLTHPMTEEQKMKGNARAYLHTYVKRGKVKRKPCQVCGSVFAHAHHEDYSKPLEVEWLCKKHHLQLHGKMVK